jgi:hypothetical protein
VGFLFLFLFLGDSELMFVFSRPGEIWIRAVREKERVM